MVHTFKTMEDMPGADSPNRIEIPYKEVFIDFEWLAN